MANNKVLDKVKKEVKDTFGCIGTGFKYGVKVMGAIAGFCIGTQLVSFGYGKASGLFGGKKEEEDDEDEDV